LLEACIEAAALDHEAVDHAVEHGAVVVAVAHVLQEILDALGRLRRVELEANGAGAGTQVDLRIGARSAVRGRDRRNHDQRLQQKFELHAAPS